MKSDVACVAEYERNVMPFWLQGLGRHTLEFSELGVRFGWIAGFSATQEGRGHILEMPTSEGS